MTIRNLSEFVEESKQKDRSAEAFELESSHLLEVKLDGRVWAKSGSMVAHRGGVKFTRQGLMEQGLGNLLKKAVSGEGMQLMKVEGNGRVYLADAGKKITLLRLGGEAIFVNGNDVLAFEDGIAGGHQDDAQGGRHGFRRPVQHASAGQRRRRDHLALRAADAGGDARPAGVHRPECDRGLVGRR